MAKKKKAAVAPKKTSLGSSSTYINPFKQGFWKQNLVPALILLLIPFVLYGSTVSFDYVLDDKIVLTENKFVQKGFAGIGEILKTESFTGFLGEQQDLVVGARYRPLSLVTFAMEQEVFGQSPAISHLLNVLLYALTGLLIFRCFFLLIPDKKENKWFLTVAFAGALLFILHPVHSEVVANIKGRDEILALLFSMATLYYTFRYIIEKKAMNLVLGAACFLLGILAKENTLTFLGVIPLAVILFTKIPRKRLITAVVPLFAVTLIYLMIRVDIIGYLLSSGKEVTALMNNPFVDANGGEKLATIVYTMGRYLGLCIFPHPLTHDYYPYHIPIMNWGDWQVWLALVLNLGFVALAISQWKKSRVLSFSIAFYFLTIFITSNIPFTVGTFMNERFLFMPSVGFSLLLAYLALHKLPAWKKEHKQLVQLGMGVLATFAVGFAFKTFARVPAWENNHTLNEAAIQVSVNSARANQYYAYSRYEKYLEEKEKEQPDREYQLSLLEEAYPYVNKALEIHPNYTDALTCKGGVLGGFYSLNKDPKQLLDGFFEIATSKQVPFTDSYLNWFNRRGKHYNELMEFYHKVGFEFWWQKQHNAGLARKYLNMGLSVVADHPQLVADLRQVK